MKRACVFVHYDKGNCIDPYVYGYLKAIKPFVDELIFVTTALISNEDRVGVETLGAVVICRENIGYDFYSWKVGIASIDLSAFDELLQINDSCYAPLFNFSHIFEKMDKVDCDFWGITKSYEISTHLQSFFVCYRKSVLENKEFQKFWINLDVIPDKMELIKSYEIGLSQLLLKNGFKMESFFKTPFKSYCIKFPRNFVRRVLGVKQMIRNPYQYIRGFFVSNPTHYYYQEMLKQKIPLIKIELIRDNPLRMPIENLRLVSGINKELLEQVVDHQLRVGSTKYINQWVR